MKKINLILLSTTVLISVSFSALAHDPKEHMKKPEKANCAALEKMKKDNKKMNMSDPIMLAMMKKCEKQAKTKMKDHEGMASNKMEHKEKIDKKKNDEHNHKH